MNKKLLAGLIVIVLVGMACAPLSILNQDNGGNNGGVNSNVLFQDDFSSSSSGWDQYSGDNGSADYASGSYNINVSSTDYLLFANPGQSFPSDVSIEVDATKAGGPDDNAFGVICRYQDVDNFYFFLISSDGYTGIAMYKNNELSFLTGDGMTTSDAITQGAATNHIQADCIGSSLNLYVNGTLTSSATDSSFSRGDVGLLAKSFSIGGVDLLFDNLVVSQP
jgi:hypothetical protein